ncbi:MAG: hypothetical protein APR54_10585 [Candidatus Cloacimonas sp. SDB]|nr:MAG: hypothetical protein APR54_10585 [Candidatus Cloacimonas sp. SDB]
MKPAVIRASAGTGKTYRLSLEFINLLLKYRADFEEILVITFTKKATAEIRERIFSQLRHIVFDTEDAKIIKQSFQKDINAEIQFNQADLEFLTRTYNKMITAKSNVKVNTIDSFVNNIFSGIIAPYRNITEFRIDNKINRELLPEIFDRLLQSDTLPVYADIFLQAKKRNLQQFHKLILDIIENRWLFEFIDPDQLKTINLNLDQTNVLPDYVEILNTFLPLLQTEMMKKSDPVKALLQKDFLKAFQEYSNATDLDKETLPVMLQKALTDLDFLNDHHKLLLSEKNIWNGVKIKSSQLKELYPLLQNAQANLLFYEKALDEQNNIILLAAEILQVYDEIKIRDKIFTHSDISYYTLKNLYDPELSAADESSIINIFYEQLSYTIRFVLIDEFQDTSILQWSIFKPILQELLSGTGQKDYGSVIVVGDEKQAIYGWRGGERKLLTSLQDIMKYPVTHHALNTSYRSKPVLINWINQLFSSPYLNFVEDWEYKKIDPAKPEGGFVQVNFRNSEQLAGIQNKLPKAEIYREFVENILAPCLADRSINPADTAILMRKNDELAEMASTLEAAGINYTLDNSGSLFDHKAVKPVMSVLKFLVYEDLYELVKFLRSDLLLLEPEIIRDILENIKSSNDLHQFLKNENNQIFSVIHKIITGNFSLQQILKTILEEFKVIEIFHQEIDLKNLLRFLEVSVQFQKTSHEYSLDLAGFLSYCAALQDKDEYTQIGQAVSDSLKLLTIHKSKGLQFETVFTVLDVTSSVGNSGYGLNFYYDFDDKFSGLEDFAITCNYAKVIEKSEKNDLISKIKKREAGDELNNLYVAFTRPKNNLFIYLHYNKKIKEENGLQQFVSDLKDESSVLKLMTRTMFREFQDQIEETSQVQHFMKFGELSRDETTEKTREILPAIPEAYFSLFDYKKIEPFKKVDLFQIKKEILKNHSIQIGNIAHEYLSHIEFYDQTELQKARNKTLAKYGNLFSAKKIFKILAEIDNFMVENSIYFDKKYWDSIMNELVIFDRKGNEFRIDRMMINFQKKEIMIVDFKTGKFQEQEQLDNYRNIICKLEKVKRKNYSVKTRFLEIHLNQEI